MNAPLSPTARVVLAVLADRLRFGTGAIPLRDYVVPGLVSEATVNALLAFGEPMVTETTDEEPVYGIGIKTYREYRAWIRLRSGGRMFGHPWHSTPQFAATALLEKLEGRR